MSTASDDQFTLIQIDTFVADRPRFRPAEIQIGGFALVVSVDDKIAPNVGIPIELKILENRCPPAGEKCIVIVRYCRADERDPVVVALRV